MREKLEKYFDDYCFMIHVAYGFWGNKNVGYKIMVISSVDSLSGARGEVALKVITNIAQTGAEKSTGVKIEPTVQAGAKSIMSDRTQAAIAAMAWDPNKKPSEAQIAKLVEYYSTHDEPMSHDEVMMLTESDWASGKLGGDLTPPGLTSEQFKQLAKNVIHARYTHFLKMQGIGSNTEDISNILAALKSGNVEIYANGECSNLFGHASSQRFERNGNVGITWNSDDVDRDTLHQKVAEGMNYVRSHVGVFAFTFTYR